MLLTDSRPFQRLTFGEIEIECGIKDTPTLVRACKNANVSHEKRAAILQLLGRYVSLFDALVASESDRLAMEFVELANVKVDCTHAKKLLQSVFNALCRKISNRQYGYEKLVEALSYFLLSVDCLAFEGNSMYLLKIARDIMQKLGPEQTYSRGTFPTHSISLFALHHICSVIHEVDEEIFHHDKQDGLYGKMSECLQGIISNQSYYPFRYQASVTLQSLARMSHDDGMSSKERRYRLFCAVKGTAYFCQALVGAFSMHFDFDSLKNGIEEWSNALASDAIEQSSWYETVQTLIASRLLVQNDPNELERFEECILTVEDIQAETTEKEDKIALRFAMIHEVTILALDSQDQAVKVRAVSMLEYFGQCCSPGGGWAQDSDVLEAVVEAALKVGEKLEFRQKIDILLGKISFHNREQIDEMKHSVKQRAQWNEESGDASTLSVFFGADSLFNTVKSKLSGDASKAAQVETESMHCNQLPRPPFEQLFSEHDLAHCASSCDPTREPETTGFLARNKYCANFRQALCLKVQELTKSSGLDGYLKVKTHVDAKPPALAYCQHILLSLELLEAALAASEQQDRKKILDSAKVFEDAIELTKYTMCDQSNFRYTPRASVKNAAWIASVTRDVWHFNVVRLDLFVKVVKVVRYFPEHWEAIKKVLKPYSHEMDACLTIGCIISAMRAVPEETDKLLDLYRAIFNNEEKESNVLARQCVSKFTRLVRDSRILKCTEYLSKIKGRLVEILPKRCIANEKLKQNFARYRLQVVAALLERAKKIAQPISRSQPVLEKARDGMALILNTMPKTPDGILSKAKNWAWSRIHERLVDETEEMSLEELLETYIKGHDDLLIPFIVPKLFSTPVTMHGLEGNGPTKLIIQRELTSKNEYTFKRHEDVETFLLAIVRYTQHRFPEVAALMAEEDTSKKYQRSSSFLSKLRNRL